MLGAMARQARCQEDLQEEFQLCPAGSALLLLHNHSQTRSIVYKVLVTYVQSDHPSSCYCWQPLGCLLPRQSTELRMRAKLVNMYLRDSVEACVVLTWDYMPETQLMSPDLLTDSSNTRILFKVLPAHWTGTCKAKVPRSVEHKVRLTKTKLRPLSAAFCKHLCFTLSTYPQFDKCLLMFLAA